MFFLLGLVIILFCLVFCVVILGGDVSNFIDFASLVLTIGPLLGVLTATQSFKIFGAGLRAAIFPKKDISEELRERAVLLFRLLSKTAAMSAAIVTLISLVNMLFNINLTDFGYLYMIGINVAASLISLLHGLLLIVAVFEPVVFILKKRRDTAHH